jgi:hypothetical protein
MDVDSEFTVTRLAKIANTRHRSVYGELWSASANSLETTLAKKRISTAVDAQTCDEALQFDRINSARNGPRGLG